MNETAPPNSELRTELQASFAFHRWLEELARKPYDGVAGWPPTWMPSPLVHEFKAIRSRLLGDTRSLEDFPRWKRILRVRKDMRAVRLASAQRHEFATKTSNKVAAGEAITAEYWRQTFVPLEVVRDLEALIYIQDLASLGDIEGLKAYLGEETLGGQLVLRGQTNVARLQVIAKLPRPNRIAKAIVAILATDNRLRAKEIISRLREDPDPDLQTDLKEVTDDQLEKRISRRRE